MAAPATATATATSALRLSIGAHKLLHLRSSPKHSTLSFRPLVKCSAVSAKTASTLTVKEKGQTETLDSRVFFQDSNGKKNQMATPDTFTSKKTEGKDQNQMATPDTFTSKKTEGKDQASVSPRNHLDAHEILKYPLSTESAVRSIEENNTYIFVVAKKADKKMIRAAVENMYDIQVKKVNTAITPDGTKKAFVKLSSKLDLNL